MARRAGTVEGMPQSVPEWAPFFTLDRFAVFMDRLHHTLVTTGRPFAINAEAGTWRYDGAENEYGLLNLAQLCNSLPMDDWDQQIEHFVQAVSTIPTADAEATTIEELRPYLRVRLYHPEALTGAPALKMPITEGLVVALVADYPDRVVTVNREEARTYGLSSEELLDLGMANVREHVQAERHVETTDEGGKLISLSGPDFCTASLALAPDIYAGPEPEAGFLLSVPNRHEVLAVPIETDAAIQLLPPLVNATRSLFQRGPGSISPFVYWVRNRRWARIEFTWDEEGLAIEGPEEFVEAIQELPTIGDSAPEGQIDD